MFGIIKQRSESDCASITESTLKMNCFQSSLSLILRVIAYFTLQYIWSHNRSITYLSLERRCIEKRSSPCSLSVDLFFCLWKKSISLPSFPVKMNKSERIISEKLFVHSETWEQKDTNRISSSFPFLLANIKTVNGVIVMRRKQRPWIRASQSFDDWMKMQWASIWWRITQEGNLWTRARICDWSHNGV